MKQKLLKKTYKEAKKTITLGGRKYYLYSALFRTEKNFKNLIPFLKEESKNIKILLDIDSDVCLVYGTKRVLGLLKENKKAK